MLEYFEMLWKSERNVSFGNDFVLVRYWVVLFYLSRLLMREGVLGGFALSLAYPANPSALSIAIRLESVINRKCVREVPNASLRRERNSAY
mgnify:CR=1 FL=1